MAQKDFERLLTLPEELRLLPRWVLWGYEARDGRPTKVPYAPADGRTSSTDAVTWTTFEKALEALEPGSHAGLGCMIGEPYVGVDLARTMAWDLGPHATPDPLAMPKSVPAAVTPDSKMMD